MLAEDVIVSLWLALLWERLMTCLLHPNGLSTETPSFSLHTDLCMYNENVQLNQHTK